MSWTPRVGQLWEDDRDGETIKISKLLDGVVQVTDVIGNAIREIPIGVLLMRYSLIHDPNEEWQLSANEIAKTLHHYCDEQNCNDGLCELVNVCGKCPTVHRLCFENSVLAIRFLADWKEKQVELEKVWRITIFEKGMIERSPYVHPREEKMVKGQLDGQDDIFFREFLKDKADPDKKYFMNTDIVVMAKERE